MSTNYVNILGIAEKRRHESAVRIKEARSECDMSQQNVADQLGKDRSTLSKYESGKGEPDIEDYIKFATLYGKSLEYLMALDVITDSNVKVESNRGRQINEELDEIEYEVDELLNKKLPQGANLESLRSSVRLIQSFLESFDKLRSDD